jgi:transcriptional regulator GlxA family with amidase domain
VSVEADRIYVKDGSTYTSAGVTAGMDLALALVADDLGPDVARGVARQLVMYVQRPGGQADDHYFGHAAYTRLNAMLFNTTEIVRTLYS